MNSLLNAHVVGIIAHHQLLVGGGHLALDDRPGVVVGDEHSELLLTVLELIDEVALPCHIVGDAAQAQ